MERQGDAVVLPPSDDCGQTLSEDGEIDGEWAAGCESQTRAPRQGSGARLARYYTFSLSESSDVTITLESDTDPYLYLRKDDARSGIFITENDDIEYGRNLNSRIRQTLEAGDYTIEATTYKAGETGSFTLSISGLSETGAPVDDCGQILSEDGEIPGEWTADCESQTRAPRPGSGTWLARYYTFSLNESSGVTITLESDEADAYLYLRRDNARSGELVNDPAADNDIEYDTNLNSRIHLMLGAGTYTIEATTYKPGEAGSFTLSISISGLSETGDPVDDCGQILSEDGEIPGEWTADCESQTSAPRQGSGTWLARYYTFSLNESSGVTITLESDEADAYLYLRRDNARSGEPVNDPAADDDIVDGSNLDSRIHLMLGAGTYTIEATTYKAGETGSFTLTLTVAGLTSP